MERNLLPESKLLASLIEVQRVVGPIVMNRDLFGGAKYLDLAEILTTVRPILADHGVLLQQTADVVDRDGKPGVLVMTELINLEGEYIRSFGKLGATQMNKANPTQMLGASISYLRRFLALTILGIAGSEDDDEAGYKVEATTEQTEPGSDGVVKPEDQAQMIRDAIKDLSEDKRLTDQERLQIKAACANARNNLSALQGVLNNVQTAIDEKGKI